MAGDIFNAILAQLGVAGLIAAILWYFANWFQKQYIAQQVQTMEVNKELVKILVTVVRENTSAFIQQAHLLTELKEMLREHE